MNATLNNSRQFNTREAILQKPPRPVYYSCPMSNGLGKNHLDRLFVSLAYMAVGTGGSITPYGMAEWSRRTCRQNLHPLISVVESPSPTKIVVRTLAEHITNVRDGFAISMSDLASILGITRPTAYAWLRGDEPKPEKVPRIQRLSEIADRVKEMNISRIDKLMHRPLSDGRSLFDVLKAEEDPSDLLVSLQALAAKEAETRQKPKGSGKNLRSLDDALGDFSVPIDFDTNGAR
jgi:transcriptional regulator with XRE-family HTH domain